MKKNIFDGFHEQTIHSDNKLKTFPLFADIRNVWHCTKHSYKTVGIYTPECSGVFIKGVKL